MIRQEVEGVGEILGVHGHIADVARRFAKQGSFAVAPELFVRLIYPDTPHAFHAGCRPSDRKPQADDGWKRCPEWFRAPGVA